MFLPVGETQFEFWKLRCSGLPNINITYLFKTSRQDVSRALITMDERIEKNLLETAQANQIMAESINVEHGILFNTIGIALLITWRFFGTYLMRWDSGLKGPMTPQSWQMNCS